MSHGTRAVPRPRRPCSTTQRPVAAIIAAATLALLAACSGGASSIRSSDSPNAAASSRSPSAVAYSTCMRSHGVPNFPDPDSDGQLPKADAQHLGVSSSQLQTSQEACKRVLPSNGGVINANSIQQCMEAGDCPQPLAQQVLNEERSFALCMRSRGVPNWPDPSIDSEGRPVFVISISKLGFDPYSREVWSKGDQCSHLMPGLAGLPAEVSP